MSSTDPQRWAGRTPLSAPGGDQPLPVPPVIESATVQSHGFVLGVDVDSELVEVVSSNLVDLTGVDPAAALGRTLVDLLGEPAAARLVGRATVHETEAQFHTVRLPPPPVTTGPDGSRTGQRTAWNPFEVVTHRSGRRWVLEFEPTPAHQVSLRAVHDSFRRTLDHPRVLGSVTDRCAAAAGEVRALTGYDRVMVYRFDTTTDTGLPAGGTVIAEAAGPGVTSYRGRVFPPDMVPAAGRDRYERLLLRLVADVDDRPADLLYAPGAEPGTDVSVLHQETAASLEDLRRLGIAAIMTVPLVVDGRLWGLLACHHRTPRRVSHDVRAACEMLGRLLSIEVRSAQAEVEHERLARRGALVVEVVTAMSLAQTLAAGAARARPALLGMVSADGVVLELDGDRVTAGDTPTGTALDRLVDHVADLAGPGEQLWATDTLPDRPASATDDPGGVLTGVLHLPLGGVGGGRALWLRHTTGTARPWLDADLAAAAGFAAAVPALQLHRARQILAERELTAAADLLAAATRTSQLEHQVHQKQRLESLGQLAGGVAHDFNNLLAVIGVSTEFVAEQIDEATRTVGGDRWAAAAADLEQVRTATRHAADLTRQLLAFARREPARPQPVDLNAAITSLAQLLRRTLGERVDLVTALAPGLPSVLADPGHVEQVLVNLAVNARDAMPAGGRLVVDTAHPDPAHPGSVRLRVSDTGTGMSRAVIDRMFDPFFTTKPTGRGTGLGLATVHGIVTQAGGTISVDSRPGRGTVFTLLFPVTAPVAPSGPDQDRAPGHRGGQTVLVVDDRPDVRDVTTRVLCAAGYTVLTATDGPGALALARDHPHPVGLLLTDLDMPRMNGDDLAAALGAAQPDLRVVLMTGYDSPSRSRDPDARRHPVLDKPFTRSALLTAVADALDAPA